MLREAKHIQFPLVNISSWLEQPGVPTVRHDYAAVGDLAAAHLLEKGFRRFGCVVVPGGWFLKARRRAACERLESQGCQVSTFTLKTTQPLSAEPIAAAERERFGAWVRTLEPPAGLILTDDWDAPTLMQVCHEVGMQIPRDLVMITTGCHSEVLPLCPVPLTVVQEDQETQARVAAACLDQLMAGGYPSETIIDIPPVGIIERESTATMAIEDREVAHTVEFIRAHGCDMINIADVCARVHVARVTLERRFRQVMEQSLHDYLIQQRINRAQELLSSPGPVNLQRIALQCGFSDRRHLNQVFTRLTGKTPAAWRAEHIQTAR
jgi:LacI family transcriptional regulator